MGWFDPKCPIDLETKAWLDASFCWLINEFGIESLREIEVILPIAEYFPAPFDGSESSIRTMVEQVCVYMSVDPKLVRLGLYRNETGSEIHQFAAAETGSHALGTYHTGQDGRYNVSLDTGQATNAEAFIATIAHELGHVILIGEQRLDPDYEDHEPMTDLVVIFYGLGIFTANSIFSFGQYTNTMGQGWRAERRGYLTEEMCGYALALFALARNEPKPDWTSYLNQNVRTYLKQSLKFLCKDGNVPSELSTLR